MKKFAFSSQRATIYKSFLAILFLERNDVRMTLSDAIRKRIKNLLKEKDMNVWKLYKATGVPASTLSYFMNGKRELITLKTLLHICEGFEIKLADFFNDPLFDDVEQD